MLADSFGRIATDLRVSLTDRCNLRCSYCMPAEGLDWLPSPALLTDGELARLIGIAVQQLGITEVRFTGGEPLLRRGLPGIVARTAALRPRPEISLTTNGIGLARLAGPLREAGLDRLNVSLDTLSRRDVRDTRPAGPAARRAGRPVRRGRRRADAGQGERGAHARRQRPRGHLAAAVLPGPRVPAPVHRADAAGRPARLAAGRHGHRRRDPGRPVGTSSRSPPQIQPTGDQRPPRPSWSMAAPAASASSGRSPGPSAGHATGSG